MIPKGSKTSVPSTKTPKSQTSNVSKRSQLKMSSGFDRGAHATVTLFFDGSASPNPGRAGWGAEAIIRIQDTTETVQWSAPIGHSTNNGAEYLGLISGLRRVINYLQAHSIRHPYVRLKIQGDSKLVIDHLTDRAEVRSPLLYPLYKIASNLVARFMKVQFVHCSRERNQSADHLANQARQASPSPAQKAIYYPALTNLVNAWVGNCHTVASHDFMTGGSDPSCFIDARFLQSLPGGEQLLSTLQDPHPLSLVAGKVDMTVVGITTLDLGVAYAHDGPDPEAEQRALVDVVVVHWLPVPLHISHRHPKFREPEMFAFGSGVRFNSENVPERHSQHAYWRRETSFIGVEM